MGGHGGTFRKNDFIFTIGKRTQVLKQKHLPKIVVKETVEKGAAAFAEKDIDKGLFPEPLQWLSSTIPIVQQTAVKSMAP